MERKQLANAEKEIIESEKSKSETQKYVERKQIVPNDFTQELLWEREVPSTTLLIVEKRIAMEISL